MNVYQQTLNTNKGFIRNLLLELTGSTIVNYQGQTLDFGKEEWNRINYVEKLTEILGFDFLSITEPQELKDKIGNLINQNKIIYYIFEINI